MPEYDEELFRIQQTKYDNFREYFQPNSQVDNDKLTFQLATKVYKTITNLGFKKNFSELQQENERLDLAHKFFREKLNNKKTNTENSKSMPPSNIDFKKNVYQMPAKKDKEVNIDNFVDFRDMHVRNVNNQTVWLDSNYITKVNCSSVAKQRIAKVMNKSIIKKFQEKRLLKIFNIFYTKFCNTSKTFLFIVRCKAT